MGCGSSKTAQLTVAPINARNELKSKEFVSEIPPHTHTIDSMQTENEVIESLQGNIPEIRPTISPTIVNNIDTPLDKEMEILTQPINDVTDNVELQQPNDVIGNAELQPIEELIEHHSITTETCNDQEVFNFDNVWSYNCGAISERARVLTEYQSTEPLNLKWCHITPNSCRLIPFWVNNASNLEAIDLSNNYIGPEGFRALLLALAYLPNLKYANLSSNKADKNCSESIQNFITNSPSLEELDISRNELSAPSFGRDLANGLQLAANIVSLNLSACGLVDIEPLLRIDSHCGFAKTVRRLDLSHNPINKQIFSSTIGEFMSKVQLKELSLEACDLTSHSMTKLTLSLLDDATMLKLNTSSNKFSDKAALVQLVTVCFLHGGIRELVASNVTYQEEKGNREYQTELASLIRDKLQDTDVNSDLKKLTLSNCLIDGAALQIIRSNMLSTRVQLNELDLSYNFECIGENIRRFACGAKPGENILSQLETLTDGSNTGDDLIRLLRDGVFPSLKKVSLVGSRISPARVGNLSEFICKIVTTDLKETAGDTPMLTGLVLDGIKLSGTNRSAIVNLFNAITFLHDSSAKVNWSLTSLSLNLCSLNDSDIKPIAQALNNGLHLEELSLSYNRLGDSAIADLTEGLINSRTIRMVNLSNNRISSKGGTALADCLSRLPVERVLVAGNLIGPDGILALINLTRICTGLTLLDLRDQKADFSDNYYDLFESNIIEVIESRSSPESTKSLVKIKLSGIGECHSRDWGRVDSLNVETNIRKYKVTTLGLWEALTLLHCFTVARNPTAQRYRRKYTDSFQGLREGMGELQATKEEWRLILGSSHLLPSWLFVEEIRERGVFLSGLPVGLTLERLEGVLETHVNCRVVEVLLCEDPVRQEHDGSAWVLFEDKTSVVNAVEYYKNGLASLYGNPFVITPLAVRIVDANNMTGTDNLEIVRADIAQRAVKRKPIQHTYEKRHGNMLANPAYKGGRVW